MHAWSLLRQQMQELTCIIILEIANSFIIKLVFSHYPGTQALILLFKACMCIGGDILHARSTITGEYIYI